MPRSVDPARVHAVSADGNIKTVGIQRFRSAEELFFVDAPEEGFRMTTPTPDRSCDNLLGTHSVTRVFGAATAGRNYTVRQHSQLHEYEHRLCHKQLVDLPVMSLIKAVLARSRRASLSDMPVPRFGKKSYTCTLFFNKNVAWLRNLKKELSTQCHGGRFRVWRWEQGVVQCLGDEWVKVAQKIQYGAPSWEK